MTETTHRPLRDRKNVLSSDVADAIEMLINRDMRLGSGLPMAFTRSNVVEMLIEIAHTDDAGNIQQIFQMLRQALTDVYTNRLTNTNVFQAGYKRYERRSSSPICPVTDFFFKVVFANGEAADCLDAMSDLEIRHSLPKRRSVAIDGGGEPIVDEEGEVVNAGEIAGIVVFPSDFQARLLAAWLHRRAQGAIGSLRKTTTAIEHARPKSLSVEHLKEAVRGVPPAMRQALPRPTKRED